MSIFRVQKDKNYSVINNTFIFDNNLSWKAKGILSYFLARPDDWEFYMSEIIKHAKDGKDSLKSGVEELIEAGYIKRDQKINIGKFQGYDYTVYEQPMRNIHSGKTAAEKPISENPQLLSTDSKQNTDNNNILCREVIDYFNQIANKNYKATTKDTKKHINARIKEGFTLDDFKKVIDTKTEQWEHDNHMKAYLRPQTLFGPKFESYLNEYEHKEYDIESDVKVAGVNA